MHKIEKSKKPEVLLLQRAIPHYRLSLFRQLSLESSFHLTICTAAYDFQTSTGLPAENLDGLNVRLIKVYKFRKLLLFQQIVSLKHFDILIIDLSINILSNPVYLFLAKIYRVKVIGWGKGIPQNINRKESLIHRWYKRIISNQCECLILYGEISRRYFDSLGMLEKPKFVAQNTIDTQWLIENRIRLSNKGKQLREDLGLKNLFIYGYFGKLTDRKKVDKIIEAFMRIKNADLNAVLVIAGSGPSETRLKSLTEKWEFRSSVIYLGKIEPGNEGIVINLFDTFLSFSQGGLGILEAMATSRLIISTPEVYPETELLIDQENCLLSEDFTVESFAKSMLSAFEIGERRVELGSFALKTVTEKATINKMVESFRNAINMTVNIR